jgi:hypothetical protein
MQQASDFGITDTGFKRRLTNAIFKSDSRRYEDLTGVESSRDSALGSSNDEGILEIPGTGYTIEKSTIGAAIISLCIFYILLNLFFPRNESRPHPDSKINLFDKHLFNLTTLVLISFLLIRLYFENIGIMHLLSILFFSSLNLKDKSIFLSTNIR